MKKYLICLLVASFTTINLYPQSNNLLPNKINSSSNIFIEYALFEVEFYKNGEAELKNKNVNILGKLESIKEGSDDLVIRAKILREIE